MIIHVDTSFLVDLLRERGRESSGPAHAFVECHADDQFRMSVFVACEFWTGVERARSSSGESEAVEGLVNRIPVVVPGTEFPSLYGRTLEPAQRRGRSIATMGLLIACSALEDEAPLVTANVRHFERVEGLGLLAYRT